MRWPRRSRARRRLPVRRVSCAPSTIRSCDARAGRLTACRQFVGDLATHACGGPLAVRRQKCAHGVRFASSRSAHDIALTTISSRSSNIRAQTASVRGASPVADVAPRDTAFRGTVATRAARRRHRSGEAAKRAISLSEIRPDRHATRRRYRPGCRTQQLVRKVPLSRLEGIEREGQHLGIARCAVIAQHVARKRANRQRHPYPFLGPIRRERQRQRSPLQRSGTFTIRSMLRITVSAFP
jgi:hypothetical protein